MPDGRQIDNSAGALKVGFSATTPQLSRTPFFAHHKGFPGWRQLGNMPELS
jgi:hypothetical protein